MSRVPGVVIPDAILDCFYPIASAEDQNKLGQDIAIEQIRQLSREG